MRYALEPEPHALHVTYSCSLSKCLPEGHSWYKWAMESPLSQIATIAAEQATYVSTAQAARVGVGSRALARLAATGALERVLRGVYRVRAAPEPPYPELLAAWTLLADGRLPWERPARDAQPPVVVSHTAAAALYELGTFPPARPTFIVTKGGREPPSHAWRTFALDLAADEHRERFLPQGIRLEVTTPERTLVDLAWAEADPDHVTDALGDALDRRLVDLLALRAALDRRWQRRGRGTPTWFRDAVRRAA